MSTDKHITAFVTLTLTLLMAGYAVYNLGVSDGKEEAGNGQSSPPSAAAADDWPDNYDFYKDYRSKVSYLGTIDTVKLERGAVYYMPNDVQLIHSGHDEWLIRELSAPVLRHSDDAGPDPYQVQVAYEPNSYMYEGGSGLQVTLPARPDFGEYTDYPKDPNGKPVKKAFKPLDRPTADLRDPGWRHKPMIVLNRVVPAPGFKLEDYYEDNSHSPSHLPVGQSAFVFTGALKIVADSSRGYLDAGYEYEIKPDPKIPDHHVKITSNGKGLTVCIHVRENQRLDGHEQPVYHAPGDYRPIPGQLPVTLACP